MNQHLLMIEDDARLAAMVAQYLQQSGYTVSCAGDGHSGLESLANPAKGTSTDLVILDLMLPDMDGLEVCRRIRALPSGLAQTPVLMLTAKGDAMDRIIGLEIGADDYLPKPFEAEVRAAVKASIDRGVPVHYGSEEDGLIIGYGNNGQRWWCVHPYHEGGKKAFWHDEGKGFAGGKWPWGIMVWTGPKRDEECVSKRNLTLAALRQAVEMWNTEKQQAYFCGEAAYAHWLRWLGDVEAGKVADPASGLPGNSWCYAVLIHSRRIAGRWLNQAAGDFTGESASQLRIAAEHYAQIAEVCMKDLKSPWDLTPGIDHWTSQLRQQQIARLEAAREHDRAAVDGLTTALETLK